MLESELEQTRLRVESEIRSLEQSSETSYDTYVQLEKAKINLIHILVKLEDAKQNRLVKG